MNKIDVSVFIVGVALGISISALFLLFQINNLFEKSHWEVDSRCYYFNNETECGKTRFCPTHLSEQYCKDVGGEWLLETQENEAREWSYWKTLEYEREVK